MRAVERAIVAGEEDDRVVSNLQRLEPGQQPADAVVQAFHHCAIHRVILHPAVFTFALRMPAFGVGDAEGGGLLSVLFDDGRFAAERRVNVVVCEIREKWLMISIGK